MLCFVTVHLFPNGFAAILFLVDLFSLKMDETEKCFTVVFFHIFKGNERHHKGVISFHLFRGLRDVLVTRQREMGLIASMRWGIGSCCRVVLEIVVIWISKSHIY